MTLKRILTSLLRKYYVKSMVLTFLKNIERFKGEIAAGKSDFNGQCKGKQDCRAMGKIAIFEFLKPNGKVYIIVVPNIFPYYFNKINTAIFLVTPRHLFPSKISRRNFYKNQPSKK